MKDNTHLVLKKSWIEGNLTFEEREILFILLEKIKKRIPEHKYYICNQDEPYAAKVLEVIKEGEKHKMSSSKYIGELYTNNKTQETYILQRIIPNATNIFDGMQMALYTNKSGEFFVRELPEFYRKFTKKEK